MDGPEDHLTVGADRTPGRVVVTLTGEVSVYTTPVLSSALDDFDAEDVVIDLRDVDRIDAGGLGFLVSVTERRHGHGTTTDMIAQGGLEQLFGYTRLKRVVSMYPTLDAALAS